MRWLQKNSHKPKLGLVLPGGGARAAYQVGVLRAVARILPKNAPSPFPIITGTSAGSINAVALAIHAQHFRRGVLRISRVWENFHVDHVFRADTLSLLRNSGHWMTTLMLGGLGKYNPSSLLDRTPLRPLLQRYLPCDTIQNAIDSGNLLALGVTASNYETGQSVTFFQDDESLDEWNRERRIGVRQNIDIDHMMASSAIPLIFEAELIGNEYYGDGSMRQIAPLSPAVHLGADRLLVVGIRKPPVDLPLDNTPHSYPSLAQVAGHAMNSIFLDSLDMDLERLKRINKTISLISDRKLEQGGVRLRPVDVLTIAPSQSIDEIAARHIQQLPRTLRFLLRGVGAAGEHGASITSYLLFEKTFCRELIMLGFRDAMQRKDKILHFLDTDQAYVANES
jgi:NTE family protein